ncbi:MAG: sugar ABC transporter substrate-binding protein [Clostridia bacterium]|nr:sugar ABC transporter substrate-binding protein [Clostridia bacterium]
MKMKKLVSLVVVFALITVMGLTGCQSKETSGTSSESSSTVDSASSSTSETPSGDDQITIGLGIWGNADPLSTMVIKMVQSAADALGAKVEVLVDDGFNPDKQISNVENFIAKGVDGIIICNGSDDIMPKIVKKCDEAKVPVAIYFRQIIDKEVKEYCEKSPYYIGCVHEDEEMVGYQLGKALADKGVKKAGVINYNKGDTTAETRYNGYIKAFNELGVTKVAEQWEIITGEKAANAVEQFLSAYPDMNGLAIVGGGGEPLTGAVQALKKNNKIGAVEITGSDFGPDIKKNIQSKEISAMSGGHWTDPFYCFMLMYNFATGNPLSKGPANISMNPIFITSVEEADQYSKWFEGELLPYTADEVKQMTVKNNPDFNLEKLQSIAAAYSIKDVMTRHEGMLK